MTVAEAVTLIGALTAAVVAIGTAAVSVYTAQQSAKTHTMVNGVSQILGAAARSQGQAEGRLAEVTGGETPPAGGPPTSPTLT